MKRLHNYSQHFIRSPKLIHELIGHSNIKKTDTVYDIGAGSGVISSVLAKRAKQVVAIEFEPQTAQKLRQNMQKFDNVTVIEADFLVTKLPTESYKIFANIPFHISSPVIRKLTETENIPESIYLIVQKQFARKIVFSDKHFTGQLGVMIGPIFTARIRKPLRKTDFWPHPNVDTVLLELIKRKEPLIEIKDMSKYRSFVEDCFSTPKKFKQSGYEKLGLPSSIKPSELSLENWVELFQQND